MNKLPKCTCGKPLKTYYHDVGCEIRAFRIAIDVANREGLVPALEAMLARAKQGGVKSASLDFNDHGPGQPVYLEWEIA